MNTLKQITLATTVLLGSSLFADTPPPAPQKKPVSPGYSAPADIKLNRNSHWGVNANFLYWEAIQDNMNLGVMTPQGLSPLAVDGTVINYDPQFKPGFQIGFEAGFNYDGWNTNLEYTWFKSEHTTASRVASDSDLIILAALLMPSNTAFNSASAKWKLQLNTLDWVMGRTSLIGKRMTLRPLFGLRAAWINQQLDASYTNPTVTALRTSKSDSWGLGFNAGLHSQWLVGAGFKFYGNIEADLLYTCYTDLSSKQTRNASGNSLVTAIKQRNLNAIRPHFDIEAGIKWGAYLNNRDFHIDFALGYGFQTFWNQNMFSNFTDDVTAATSLSPNGDLFLQGLTASVRFDF